MMRLTAFFVLLVVAVHVLAFHGYYQCSNCYKRERSNVITHIVIKYQLNYLYSVVSALHVA